MSNKHISLEVPPTKSSLYDRRGTVNYYNDKVVKKNEELFTGKSVIVILSPTPIALGHLLIAPKRQIFKLVELTENETLDIFILVQKMQLVMEKLLNKEIRCVIEDGLSAGQESKHFTVNLIPFSPENEFKMRQTLSQLVLPEHKVQELSEKIKDKMNE